MIDWPTLQDAYYESFQSGWRPDVLLINREDMHELSKQPFPPHTPISALESVEYKVFDCQVVVVDVPVPIFARNAR